MFRDLHQHAKFMSTLVYSQNPVNTDTVGTLQSVVYALSGCP